VSTRAESQTIAGAKTFTDTLILQGNVGIGVSPSKKLDVAGEFRSTDGGVEFYMVPKGSIIMWSGALVAVPAGWQLCDGTNGTPDLRNKFIYGVATGENPGAAGGATSHSHTYTTVIAHGHSVSDPGHKHWVSSAQRDDGNGGGCMGNTQMYGLWSDASSYTADDPSYGAGRYDRAVGTGISITSAGSASGTTSAPTVLPPYMKLAFIMKM